MMKSFLLIFSLLCFHFAKAQKPLANNVLEAIVKDGQIFARNEMLMNKKISTDSVGRETLILTSSDNKDKVSQQQIILIDTFGFFTSECSGIYNEKRITVMNRLPSSIKKIAPNIFWVSGIATGREDALAIAILQRYSNYQVVYYFTIMGKTVRLIKTTSGNF